MSGEQALRALVTEARERADDVLCAEHVGADAKTVIKDLLEITDSFWMLLQQSQGQSSDVRVLRKKLDQSKSEMKNLTAKIEALNRTVPQVIEDIKQISLEAGLIAKRHDSSPQDPDIQSAARIRAATQRIAGLLVHLAT